MRLCAVLWGWAKNMHGHVHKLLLNISTIIQQRVCTHTRRRPAVDKRSQRQPARTANPIAIDCPLPRPGFPLSQAGERAAEQSFALSQPATCRRGRRGAVRVALLAALAPARPCSPFSRSPSLRPCRRAQPDATLCAIATGVRQRQYSFVLFLVLFYCGCNVKIFHS